jgi:glycosyltransferase involved in cell wall biosynthesis
VICISHSTRRDLLELHDALDPARVSVVHLAGPAASPTRALHPAPPVDGPYVLYVGQRDGYKNFDAVVRAFALEPALRRGARLVAFGGPLTAAEWARVRACGLDERAVTSMSGGDEMLHRLYAHAAAFVDPSLYEGFGIPPLEAMAHGCPVVCGRNSSLPEVVGDAAEHCDPESAESIAAALLRVVSSPDRTTELAALGRAQAARFSWERCAGETYAVYRDAVAGATAERAG